MPQWDFLNFLAARAQRYTGFKLYMCAEVTTLPEEAGRVVGVKASTPEGPVEVRADLVIGADGRHSTVRRQAGLEVIELGAPLDVLWFGVSRHASDPADTAVRFERGEILVLINRETHWQCGYVIPKGAAEQVRSRGLAQFQRHIAALVSFLEDRVGEISDWDKVKLLTVAVDRLRRWHRPGLLCIGDAAHAMSPIGGVGINLAIQDAIAAANLLVEPLRLRRLGEEHLSAVQRRREFPTRLTQQLQLFIQRNVIAKALHGTGPLAPPGFSHTRVSGAALALACKSPARNWGPSRACDPHRREWLTASLVTSR
jgi:2-polyprenyl-6-methoxyphenol hydroxylase-like FAD-dependent oxidoreductase